MAGALEPVASATVESSLEHLLMPDKQLSLLCGGAEQAVCYDG